MLNFVAKPPPVRPWPTHHADATETREPKQKKPIKSRLASVPGSQPKPPVAHHPQSPRVAAACRRVSLSPLRHAAEGSRPRSGSDKAVAATGPALAPHSNRPRDRFGLDLGLRGEGFWKPPPRWTRRATAAAASRPSSPPPARSCSRGACGRSCASSGAPPNTASWYVAAARRLDFLCVNTDSLGSRFNG